MKHLLKVLMIGFLISCSKSKKDSFLSISSQQISNKIISVNIDRIDLESNSLFGVGDSFLQNGKIYFLDRLNVQLLQFDANGKFEKAHITRGEGPSEIQRFESFTTDGDYKYFLSGYTLYEFDQKNELTSRTVLDFYHSSSMKEMESNPQPDDPGIYEVKYVNNEIFVRDGKFYIKIETSNPKLNFLMHDKYYQETANYGEFDLKTGRILRILGKKPPIYLNYKYIPHFDFYYHDITDEDIFISFEPDSLIYIADKDFNFKEAFGVSGKGMLQDYIQVNDLGDYDTYWRPNRTQKGFYRHVKYVPEDDLLFRTYTLGVADKTSFDYGDNPQRMQIYKEKVLIGDVEVPNYFKVIGKIGEYYYADGSGGNPDNEEIVVYKFKLD
ncbi:6-bladed beta-propeller [Belliella sp. R4-6]|uniref:6-bladed beta-propeller n=1 Tax=Belliella alkalica TaxID=1730871 RepID=A0ABS9VFA0_9BACT|nr:6-bladed beta-propeller [Belliella alkalica]MCH7415112.1 6-bladed beta-propeller [Belliella alkalica]